MQKVKTPTLFVRVAGGKAGWSALALGVLLAACQAPQAESAAVPEAAAATAPAAPAESAAPAQAPAPATQTEAATAEQAAPAKADDGAPITDEDGNPYRPDESYNRANLRPEFKKCVAASDAVTSAMEACADAEFVWQQNRMRAALQAIDAGPDSELKDKLSEEQDTYMRDTDRYCRFDPATQGQGQLLDAQSCRINRFANRADALEALIRR